MSNSLCPYCKTKPLLNKKNSKTCGDFYCKEKNHQAVLRANPARLKLQRDYNKAYQKTPKRIAYRKNFTKENSKKQALKNKHIKKWFVAVVFRDKGKCVACGADEHITIDHIIPQKLCEKWGWFPEQTHDKTNLQLLCQSCNKIKGTKNMAFLKERLNKKNKNLTKTTESGLSNDTRS